jgi:hypothetical protein
VSDASAGERLGTVAEETARLAEALGGWTGWPVQGSAPGADQSRYAARPGEDGPAEEAERCGQCRDGAGPASFDSCALCPICHGISLLRSLRPDLVERLADVATAAAAALRDLAAEASPRAEPAAGPSRTTGPSAAATEGRGEP